MKKQKIQCLVMDQDAGVTATLEAALDCTDVRLALERVGFLQQLPSMLAEKKPHLLFCPHYVEPKATAAVLEMLQRHSPDTVLVWVSRRESQGLTSGLLRVESCILPLNDQEYFSQYVDFLLHYSLIKQEFRQCKRLLGVTELRCHWLVDYSWEPIAYIAGGMHLYANNAYVTLFGFESLDEVHAMPVAQLVHEEERASFETLCRSVDPGNKPSSRLLVSLRGVDGQSVRADVRFIPAVLKGQRCTQLHVHPVEKLGNTRPVSRQPASPWDKVGQNVQKSAWAAPVYSPATPAVQKMPAAPVPAPLPAMRVMFQRSMKLSASLLPLYFSEPEFRRKDGGMTQYGQLVKQLKQPESRFRLDYWNIAQVLGKLSVKGAKVSSHLIFVSLGSAIFDNEGLLRRLIALLDAHASSVGGLVLALGYQDCLAHVMSVTQMVRLLQATGVRLALDGVVDEPQAMALVKAVKPALIRLSPELAGGLEAGVEATARLQALIRKLGQLGGRVVVMGVKDVASLNLLCTTPAAYLQGAVLKPTAH